MDSASSRAIWGRANWANVAEKYPATRRILTRHQFSGFRDGGGQKRPPGIPGGLWVQRCSEAYRLLKQLAVLPGAAEPLGTSFTWTASKRYEYPAVPACSPFLAQPIQPMFCACTR